MKCMVIVNLHEIDFLEETLTALAESHVKDCVVYNVDGIASHHEGPTLEPTVLGSVARLFTQDRNLNYLIAAVTEEEEIDQVSGRLKQLYKEDRFASSFWFIPIKGYFYHKQKE